MDIEVKKLVTFSDARGDLTELLTALDTKKHKNFFGHLFFVTFKTKKSIRGNHYHKISHEYYIPIVGKIKVHLIDTKTKKKKIITISSHKKYITRLRIGPYIAHACYSVTPHALMVGYFSKPYDRNDTLGHIIIKKT